MIFGPNFACFLDDVPIANCWRLVAVIGKIPLWKPSAGDIDHCQPIRGSSHDVIELKIALEVDHFSLWRTPKFRAISPCARPALFFSKMGLCPCVAARRIDSSFTRSETAVTAHMCCITAIYCTAGCANRSNSWPE